MAIDGIMAAVTGLQVAERRLNQNANDLANVSTAGYLPQRLNQAEAPGGGVAITSGSAAAPGPLVASERPLDLALDGGGYFVLSDGSGGKLYSRNGNFHLDAQGRLVDVQGRQVLPAITLPSQTASSGCFHEKG